jgi:hypothetical protein
MKGQVLSQLTKAGYVKTTKYTHHQNIYSYKDEVILCLKYHDDELWYSLDNKSGAAYIV